mmetsp:Transcript_11028/g.25672  ORF Transcript_11028/g.25672 Transcript_11028/m.25672 type:complete len:436 (-) Transcript_11028:127-1434(-)
MLNATGHYIELTTFYRAIMDGSADDTVLAAMATSGEFTNGNCEVAVEQLGRSGLGELGALRRQNEELVAKVAQLQRVISEQSSGTTSAEANGIYSHVGTSEGAESSRPVPHAASHDRKIDGQGEDQVSGENHSVDHDRRIAGQGEDQISRVKRTKKPATKWSKDSQGSYFRAGSSDGDIEIQNQQLSSQEDEDAGSTSSSDDDSSHNKHIMRKRSSHGRNCLCQDCRSSAVLTPEPHGFPAVREQIPERAGWLIGLMFLQSCSSFIIAYNEKLLSNHMVIVQFLTMLVGAGGNAGNQAAVNAIRSLAIGTLNGRTMRQFLTLEAKMALCLSGLIGVTGFIRAAIFRVPWGETIAITASVVCIVAISVGIGSTLPLLMKKVGIDPANSATTIQVIMDILGVLITVCVSSFVLSFSVFQHDAEPSAQSQGDIDDALR